MTNMSPFEIRLELLKMAKDHLESDYHSKNNYVTRDWDAKMNYAIENNEPLPAIPDPIRFYTEADIIATATELNKFVSNA